MSENEWPEAHMPAPLTVPEINAENALLRITEAMHTILNCWDDWNSEAENEEQAQQSICAYDGVMQAQLSAVLIGMVFDPDTKG